MKRIINILVRALVMAAVFAITVYFVNVFQNRNYRNPATEMEGAELPLAYVSLGGSLLNCMHGYTGDVDITLLRDSITPIDDNKHIEVLVENTKDYAQSYSYEVRSISGGSLIENGELEPVDNGEGFDVLGIDVRMDIRSDMEYMLVVRANGSDGGHADYYTRIVVNADYHEGELLAAADSFHEATFDFEALESESVIGTYRKDTTMSLDDTYGLGHMNLANSYSELMWDGLRPEITGQVKRTIKEIDVNYAVIEMDYVIKTSTDEGESSRFNVREFYKLCCDAESDTGVRLISFDRYVDEYFDSSGIDSINNVYEIGVVPRDELTYRCTADSKIIAFVRNGQLWQYDYEEGEMTLVFSFWHNDYECDAAISGMNDINIIGLEDDGTMTFAVYGYMSAGRHEGKLGITLYSFDRTKLELDELLFVESNVPYEAMKTETSRLTYYDGSSFYYMLGGKVNAVDIAGKVQSFIAENLASTEVMVSADMSVMAYGESDVQSENKKLTLMNIATGRTYVIDAGEGECLVCYGFKDSDMVYGVASVADLGVEVDSKSFESTRYDGSYRDSIPASRLYIVDESGNQIKEYSKSGCYLMQVDIDTNLLYLTRGEKTENGFEAIKDDFITYKEDDSAETVSTVFRSAITGYIRLYLTVPSDIYLSYIPSLNMTKEKLGRDAVSMVSTVIDDRITYNVYDNLGLTGIYDVAGDAINYAISVDGIVVSSEGEVIYRKTESQEYNTIAAAIFHKSSGTVEDSLGDCAYMVLTYEGAQVDADELASYDDIVQAMNELGKREAIDITGLSLDMVLGYVSDGVPVISRIDDGRYVLVVSYNEVDVRYYDPVQDDEIVVSRDEYESMMSKWNNELYTYVAD